MKSNGGDCRPQKFADISKIIRPERNRLAVHRNFVVLEKGYYAAVVFHYFILFCAKHSFIFYLVRKVNSLYKQFLCFLLDNSGYLFEGFAVVIRIGEIFVAKNTSRGF